MKILAVDIGGTNSRFVHFDGTVLEPGSLSSAFTVPTSSVSSFSDLLAGFNHKKPQHYLTTEEYDTVVISGAGPVQGRRCEPPNIPWNINLSGNTFAHFYIINDFVAQAYACTLPEIKNEFIQIQNGEQSEFGTLAIVGAGTGLGHCALIAEQARKSKANSYLPIASEAGHAQFSFYGQEESEYQAYLLDRLEATYIERDDVVSGRGLVYLHAFLTQQEIQPEEIAGNFDRHEQTLDWFARFYGRVSRDYCLAVLATGGLIVSGGIAAKNPAIVQHPSFIHEFLLSPSHHSLLSQIPIVLNRNEDIGLLGAVHFGLSRL